MFCKHCGAEVFENARFCPRCGQPFAKPPHADPAVTPASWPQCDSEQAVASNPVPRGRRLRKPFMIVLSGAAACALIAAVCLWAFGAFGAAAGEGDLYVKAERAIYVDGELLSQYTFSYDNEGIVQGQVRVSSGGSTDAVTTETEFSESGLLECLTYVSSDGTTEFQERYEYDDRGNIIRLVMEHQDGSSSVTEFDERGCATRCVEYSSEGEALGSQSITYEFDSEGRAMSLRYGSSPAYAFTYDDEGNLVESTNGEVRSKYTYRKIENPSAAARALNMLKPY